MNELAKHLVESLKQQNELLRKQHDEQLRAHKYQTQQIERLYAEVVKLTNIIEDVVSE